MIEKFNKEGGKLEIVSPQTEEEKSVNTNLQKQLVEVNQRIKSIIQTITALKEQKQNRARVKGKLEAGLSTLSRLQREKRKTDSALMQLQVKIKQRMEKEGQKVRYTAEETAYIHKTNLNISNPIQVDYDEQFYPGDGEYVTNQRRAEFGDK